MADINLTPDDILKKIKEKEAKLECLQCGQKNIGIAPGFGHLSLQNKIDGSVTANAPHIPVVYTVCNTCGVLTPYSAVILGIFQPPVQ